MATPTILPTTDFTDMMIEIEGQISRRDDVTENIETTAECGPRKSTRQRRESSLLLSNSYEVEDMGQGNTSDNEKLVTSTNTTKRPKLFIEEENNCPSAKEESMPILTPNINLFGQLFGHPPVSDDEAADDAVDRTVEQRRTKKFACLCLNDVDIFLADSSHQPKCQAKDRVADKEDVPCSGTSSNFKFYRAAETLNYLLLCPSHVKRLQNHECCPFCGLFCQRGKKNQEEKEGVLHCQQNNNDNTGKDGHLFHQACALEEYGANLVSCPHCFRLGNPGVPANCGRNMFECSFPSGSNSPSASSSFSQVFNHY